MKRDEVIEIPFTVGADFYQVLELTDDDDVAIDLTGSTVALTLKSQGAVALVFAYAPTAQQGRIVVNALAGTITLSAPIALAAETLARSPHGPLLVTWSDGRTQSLGCVQVKASECHAC